MKEIILYLKMNGYGFYIWTSYLIAAFLIIVLTFSVILRKKKIERKLLNLENK